MLENLQDRPEHNYTVITVQMPIKWAPEVIDITMSADAALDRLMLKGGSMGAIAAKRVISNDTLDARQPS